MDRLHQALLAATSDQVAILDGDGIVVAANTAMYERLGIAEDDLLGCCLFDLFPREVALRRKRRFKQAMQMGRPVVFEDVSSSGSLFDVHIIPVAPPGTPGDPAVCTVLSVRNLTASRRAEVERQRLATAIEQAVEAFILLGNDLTVEYVNQAFEEMTGYAQQEIKGRNIETLYQSPDQKRVLENAINSLEYGEAWMGRTTNTRKDGTVFKCEQTIARIRGKRFRPLGYVSVWRDITEIAQLEKQLRQAQKMEALGMLAGGIAHDFNNILGPIILHAELSLQAAASQASGASDAASPESRQAFEEILRASQRAKGLVDNILGLSRKREKDRPICFNLGSLVKECLKLLRPSLPGATHIRFESLCRQDLILADPTQIHQVIMNLATNAAQAMGEAGGELSITLSRFDRQSQPRNAASHPERQYVQMEVCDTGPGIPQEHLERIFDPFFTTKKEDVGTGLGLTVVRNIMKALGGSIAVHSGLEKGARFVLLFPACLPEELARPAVKAEAAGNTEHVLLVDSDPLLIQGGREALEQLGYTVTACRNPFEALAYFRPAPEQFDLCLCEAEMPGMSGVELAQELLLTRSDLPVVLCSATGEGLPLELMAHLGISACLRKPFRLGDLRETINKALASQAQT